MPKEESPNKFSHIMLKKIKSKTYKVSPIHF